jgi:hypothetical protein
MTSSDSFNCIARLFRQAIVVHRTGHLRRPQMGQETSGHVRLENEINAKHSTSSGRVFFIDEFSE